MSARTRAMRGGPISAPRGGFAMLAVVLVLLALLVLCTPFLVTASDASRASGAIGERRATSIALDAAARHARAVLGETHPAVDVTPYFDSAAELAVDNRFPADFLDANDARGTMWDLEVEDVSGRIDLDSAPPQVVANLLGRASYLTRALAADDDELSLGGAGALPPQGFVVVEGETIHYTALEASVLSGLERGLGARAGADGEPDPCGPRPPEAHAPGSVVLDLVAYGPALWRDNAADGVPRHVESLEHLRAVVPDLGRELVERIGEAVSPFAEVRAGARWQRPARLTSDVLGGFDCSLRLDDASWFNPGTTVEVRQGEARELALVLDVRGDVVQLTDTLAGDYAAFQAEVRPLARTPVNLNTAPPVVLQALFENLKLRGVNARISRGEARRLAALVQAERPFTGFQDFLERVVLPAAGLAGDGSAAGSAAGSANGSANGALIAEADAVALWRNGLNANDASLEFSTMPFAFTTRDVFDLELRASTNAASGVERGSGVRRQVDLVVPQGELMQLWARQEDFDESLRLGRRAPFWATGPHATGRYDPAHPTSPPSRALAHLGPELGPVSEEGERLGERVFASGEDDGYARLAPARAADESVPDAHGWLHFDWDTTDAEGHDLREAPLRFDTALEPVELTPDDVLDPVLISFWVKPRTLAPGTLVDLAGSATESDRVTLELGGEDLVLRVLDGAGDHPGTAFEERAEVRVPLARLAADTWSHVQLDVSGNQPEQMTLLVDGTAAGETPGLTRLTASLSPDAGTIEVESTEGFPQPPETCVLRIGDELVEAVASGQTSFTAQYAYDGPDAGFGGRMARETFTIVAPTAVDDPGVNDGVALHSGHEAGTAVELYGYSLPLASNVPAASATLPADLGRFAVAHAVGAVTSSGEGPGEPVFVPVNVPGVGIVQLYIGDGMEGVDSEVEAITLAPAPTEAAAGLTLEDVTAAFNPGGGYALVVARNYSFSVGAATADTQTLNGSRYAGWEVIRYSGLDGANLRIAERGDQVGLANLTGHGRRAFVMNWSDNVLIVNSGQSPKGIMSWQTLVIPISVPAPGAGGSFGFLATPGAGSQFAQLTRLGADAHLTEWVRYDEIANGQLVRDDPAALDVAQGAALGGNLGGDADGTVPPGGGGPSGPTEDGGLDGSKGPVKKPGPGAGGVGGVGGAGGAGALALAAPNLGPDPAAALAGSYWQGELGEIEPLQLDLPITLSVSTQLQFRGVLGTRSHAQPAGTLVLPVWTTVDGGHPFAGRPGRHDAVVLMDADLGSPGWPGIVQHAHRPKHFASTSWRDAGGDQLAVEFDSLDAHSQAGFETERVYVALEAAVPVPIAQGSVAQGAVAQPGQPGQPSVPDARTLARVVKFPSGERPREVTSLALGGNLVAGGGPAGVPAAVVDEVVFGSTSFGAGLGTGGRGGSMELAAAVDAAGLELEIVPNVLRGGGLRLGLPSDVLDGIAEDAGLLRIGEEIVGYNGLDASSGRVFVAPNGRGMLGTDPQAHARGEGVVWLAHHAVSALTGGVSAESARFELASLESFPREGTLLLGSLEAGDLELAHYTHVQGDGLGMPARSVEPGAMDGRGGGLFRGRYGTAPSAHGDGEVVVLFPFRYWDRWAEGADAPELAYLELAIEQPDAWWRGLFWDAEETAAAGVRVGVLARTDPALPWDAEPDPASALRLWREGMPGGRSNPLGVQADRLECRAFVEYLPGAFDPVDGAHGWTSAPELRLVGAEFLAPGRTLLRVDR